MGTMLKLEPSPSSEDGSFESRSIAVGTVFEFGGRLE
jgi:hypothetical protein